jgi:hypothetical protein
MNSLATAAAARTAPLQPDTSLDPAPDYCARALALWPRLERGRLARVRHDPGRVAALISRRTNLSYEAILELLGVSSVESNAPGRDH